MADVRVPDEIVVWMQERDWGNHHDMWHIVRRWDIYHARAEQGHPGSIQIVNYINANGWTRAPLQEGAAGNGLEFFAMHRAMLQLILEEFPQHAEYFQGWSTPPQDPEDPADPVPDGTTFDTSMAAGIRRIEEDPGSFPSEDELGRYIETAFRPTPQDPFASTQEAGAGVHNYMHRRWMDEFSDINIGDPRVNLFNARFWSLHGWIDRMWGRYREHQGLSDSDPEYRSLLQHHREHMGAVPHHPFAPALELEEGHVVATRPEILRTIAFVQDFD